MAKYFSKEERETIETINSILGMRHRSKAYDFANIDDLKEAFTMTVAEYIDYLRYHMTIGDVLENFDESLEYFDPVTWTSLHDSNVKGDELAQDVYMKLRETDTLLWDLSNRAEEKCRELLEIILGMESNIREDVLGKKYIYDKAALEKVFEDCLEMEYTYNVDDSRDAFVKILDEDWSVEE